MSQVPRRAVGDGRWDVELSVEAQGFTLQLCRGGDELVGGRHPLPTGRNLHTIAPPWPGPSVHRFLGSTHT